MNATKKRSPRKPRRVEPNKRTAHHRKPTCAGGTRQKPNVSHVRYVDHVAFHRLFGPGLPEVIAATINAIWIDPEYELVVRKRRVPLTENCRFRTSHPKKRVGKKKGRKI